MGTSQRIVSTGELLDGVLLLLGTVNVFGNVDGIKLDADGDTTISASTDDVIDYKIGGAVDFQMSANSFDVAANSQISGVGSNVGLFAPLAVQQTISGPGAITITEYFTDMTTTGADAFTLADGVAVGQTKEILMIGDGGDGTLTPTNLNGGTTLTFEDAGDYAILGWDDTEWVLLKSGNTVDGISAPVLA